jgi:predicted GNAT superfamily acetyltransferase
MRDIVIRDAKPADFERICALNLAEVQHTSAMDVARLTELNDLCCYHKVASIREIPCAFLLAMRDGSPYRNDNFEWFAQRYARFIYIDRVVVSAESRGRRLASLLYEDLFAHARANAVPLIACEYNVIPPNEPSRLFHQKFGFAERGSQWVADGTKRVSLQVAAT